LCPPAQEGEVPTGRDKVFHNGKKNVSPEKPRGRPRLDAKAQMESRLRKLERDRERQRRKRGDAAHRERENAKRRRGRSHDAETEMDRCAWLVAHYPNRSYIDYERLYRTRWRKDAISKETIRQRLKAAAELDRPLVRLRAPERTDEQVRNDKGHGIASSRFHVTHVGLESLGDRAPSWWIDLSAEERELAEYQAMGERLMARAERYEVEDRNRARRKYWAERRLRERLAAMEPQGRQECVA
jgi:hypothetical protein